MSLVEGGMLSLVLLMADMAREENVLYLWDWRLFIREGWSWNALVEIDARDRIVNDSKRVRSDAVPVLLLLRLDRSCSCSCSCITRLKILLYHFFCFLGCTTHNCEAAEVSWGPQNNTHNLHT